jgi:hypothetical protein
LHLASAIRVAGDAIQPAAQLFGSSPSPERTPKGARRHDDANSPAQAHHILLINCSWTKNSKTSCKSRLNGTNGVPIVARRKERRKNVLWLQCSLRFLGVHWVDSNGTSLSHCLKGLFFNFHSKMGTLVVPCKPKNNILIRPLFPAAGTD